MDDVKELQSRYQGTEYEGKPDGLYFNETKIGSDGNAYAVSTRICNAWIIPIKEIRRDDGLTVDKKVQMTAVINSKPIEPVELAYKDLSPGNFLVPFGLGVRPTLERFSKARIYDSVLAIAPGMQVENVILHTGFRVVDGKPIFFHAGGAIGGEGFSVDLGGRLSRYCFAEDTDPDRYETELQFLEVAPHSVTLPLLALVFLSPLNEFLRKVDLEPGFVAFLLGRTGTMKSTLAALALSHFGQFDNKSLPGSAKDTVNSLEKQGFLLKDALFVVDDFFPSVNRNEIGRMEQAAQGIVRAWGDRTGRGRMNADGSLKGSYPPRGEILCTGEDVPSLGQSGEARLITVDLLPGDVQTELLTAVQNKKSHLNQVMRDYIEWLIPRYEKLPEVLKSKFLEYRSAAQGDGHGRIAEAISHLQVGIEMFTAFFVSAGHMNSSDAEALNSEAWDIFKNLADKQNRATVEEKPTALFMGAMRELLDTRKIKIVSAKMFTSDTLPSEDCVGWSDERYLYLLPDACFNAVYSFYRGRDRNFPLTKNGLLRHLALEKLILTSTDSHGNTVPTRVKKINGKTKRLLWFDAKAFEIEESEEIE